VFDADVMPCVITLQKGAPDTEHRVRFARLRELIRIRIFESRLPMNVASVRGEIEGLAGLLAEHSISVRQKDFGSDIWTPLPPHLADLMHRLTAKHRQFKDFVGERCFRGVLTGLNEAFVVTDEVAQSLRAKGDRSTDLLKAWVRGQDVERWRVNWARLFIVFARQGTNIDDYPAAREHLIRWRRELEPKQPRDPRTKPGRKPGQYKWF